jgi:ABC-2 type transport system ATP-binding protein
VSLALSLRSLRKTYPDVVAVDGIDLDVGAGECFGLLGPNGAGKTTTIEICEGLTTPDSGDVVVLGRRWSTDAGELRQRLGIQLQETQVSEKLTVEETVRLFRSFFRAGPSVDEVIGLVQLDEKRGSRVGGLSGGQKQRLALACALVGDPELLFLDEPTTGLDPQARRQLWELIERFRATGRTTLLTTHYMDEAERLCDRVAIMDHGKVIALGTPRELIASLGTEHMVEFSISDGLDPRVRGDDSRGRGDDDTIRHSRGSGNPAALDLAELRAIDGVRDAHVADGGYQLAVSELHRAVPALLAELTRRGVTMSELRTRSATLEDVFVSLTGRQLRDG